MCPIWPAQPQTNLNLIKYNTNQIYLVGIENVQFYCIEV